MRFSTGTPPVARWTAAGLASSLICAPAYAGAACTGADPAIVRAGLQSTMQRGDLSHLIVAITVRNLGNRPQASNLLQSVEVYQSGRRVDRKGVPPLGPGRSATVRYEFDRSADASPGTTPLNFRLVLENAPAPGPADCNVGNDRFHLEI